jgi:hypothetical protein
MYFPISWEILLGNGTFMKSNRLIVARDWEEANFMAQRYFGNIARNIVVEKEPCADPYEGIGAVNLYHDVDGVYCGDKWGGRYAEEVSGHDERTEA